MAKRVKLGDPRYRRESPLAPAAAQPRPAVEADSVSLDWGSFCDAFRDFEFRHEITIGYCWGADGR